MNISEIYSGNSLKSTDLGDSEPVVTIAKIVPREFKQQDGKIKSKLVISFKEEKKDLVCNAINAKIIAKSYGPETDNWVGKKIQLYVDHEVEFGGNLVDGIRVRGPKKVQKPISEEMNDEVPF